MEGYTEQKGDSGKKIPAWLIPALMFLVGFAIYFNSLKGDFLWDDIHFIKNNTYLRGWSHLTEIFTSDVAAGSGMRYSYYRPLTTFTYLIDYSLFKLESRGYHLFSIAYHLLVGLALYFLISLLFQDRRLSGLTAFFWLIHPLQTETVAYISGRPDSLVALFVLLTLIFYLRQQRRRSFGLYLLMVLSCLAAVLSRENCVVLPALLLLYHFIFRKRVRLYLFLPLLLVILIYLGGRLFFLASPHQAPPLGERASGFLAALVTYLRLLLFPVHLHQEYGWHFFSFSSPPVLLGAGALAVLIIICLRPPAAWSKYNILLLRFGVGWFFIALLPVSGIYPIKANLAEHWLYLPSIGFFLLLARGALLLRRGASARRTFAALGGIALCWAVLTVHQNGYFRNPLTFYRRSVRYSPFSARLRNNLGIQYYLQGREDEGVRCFKKALELDPQYPEAYNNLGQIYMNRGREEEAEALLKKSISINPGYADGYNNLGILSSRRGEQETALRFLEKAARLNPLDPGVLFNLGLVLKKAARNGAAIRAFRRSLSLSPDRGSAYYHLAQLYYRGGELKLARSYYHESLRRGVTPDREFSHRLGSSSEY